jgi:hypothetical protein
MNNEEIYEKMNEEFKNECIYEGLNMEESNYDRIHQEIQDLSNEEIWEEMNDVSEILNNLK